MVVLIQGLRAARRAGGGAGGVPAPVRPSGAGSRGDARAAYFGFTVGGLTISIYSLVAAAVLFLLGVVATRAAQNWLGDRFLPRTRLDAGVSNSIRTIVGYVGVIAAILIAGAQLGLDLENSRSSPARSRSASASACRASSTISSPA